MHAWSKQPGPKQYTNYSLYSSRLNCICQPLILGLPASAGFHGHIVFPRPYASFGLRPRFSSPMGPLGSMLLIRKSCIVMTGFGTSSLLARLGKRSCTIRRIPTVWRCALCVPRTSLMATAMMRMKSMLQLAPIAQQIFVVHSTLWRKIRRKQMLHSDGPRPRFCKNKRTTRPGDSCNRQTTSVSGCGKPLWHFELTHQELENLYLIMGQRGCCLRMLRISCSQDKENGSL